MEAFILFVIAFIIVYLCYLFFVILNKKKTKDSVYAKFLIKTYHLDEKKIKQTVLSHVVALANAFIIAVAFTIVCFIENFILKMLLAFAVLVPVQLLVYFIIGKWLQRKYKK